MRSQDQGPTSQPAGSTAPNAAAPGSAIAPSDPRQIEERNNLLGAAVPPFHAHIALEIFDLTGKSAEHGTLDIWQSPTEKRTELTLPSVGVAKDLSFLKGTSPEAKRALFLASEWSQQFLNAAELLDGEHPPITAALQKKGPVSLMCFSRQVAGAGFWEVCTDPGLGSVRLVQKTPEEVVYNRLGKYGPVYVAQDIYIACAGRSSIRGIVESLQSYRPAADTATAVPGGANKAELSTALPRLSPGVVAGKKISGPQPEYPRLARERRSTGTVVLAAMISTEGKIEDLVPISSPDPLLTGAAMTAVKQWRYSPYLLHGAPTQVQTAITVNFNLNS